MSIDDFHVWHERQIERYELVDGYPIQRQLGARQSRAVAITNLVVALTPLARTSGCRTTSARTAVVTGSASIRYPDVVVDCGPRDDGAFEASCPTVVAEVSSEARNVEFIVRLCEYQKIDSIRTILLVDPDRPLVVHYLRGEAGSWDVSIYRTSSDRVAIEPLGLELPLALVYDDLEVA